MTIRCGFGERVLVSSNPGGFGVRVLAAVALVAMGAPAAGIELDQRAPLRGLGVEMAHYDAPAIVLYAPSDGGIYASPIGIDIDFEPAGGAAIDLSTLKVTVVTHTLIGDLTFDITDDVSPYASPGGIHARRARIPAGEHTVTISVADTLQRWAEQELTITVRDERAHAD
jgi:hypothetical protein